eukprot:TRINITY_DN64287_c0_g1_i3.p1 TRINITY_DN64287_c0_g1~~TRINITY_DN64287_c0_g1_i3.p1  ORF type:complete len:395 (+),score=45.23 TRINITY_DN64287_c0_g1_i3:71-1255(+)
MDQDRLMISGREQLRWWKTGNAMEAPPKPGERKVTQRIKFPAPLTELPRVFVCLSLVDTACSANTRLKVEVSEVTHADFEVIVSTWWDSRVYSADISWIAVPQDAEAEVGVFEKHLWQTGHPLEQPETPSARTFETQVMFDAPFKEPPQVLACLHQIDVEQSVNTRLKCTVKHVTAAGFTLVADTWWDSKVYSFGVNWLAAPKGGLQAGSQFKSYWDTKSPLEAPKQPGNRSEKLDVELGPFEDVLKAEPQVVVGLTALDVAANTNTRASVTVPTRTPTSFSLEVATWWDTRLFGVGFGWCAFHPTLVQSGGAVGEKDLPTAAEVAAPVPVPTTTTTTTTTGENNDDCVVCMERKRNVFLAPCGHVCLCKPCADQLDSCPNCRASIESRQVAYL